MKFNPNAIHCTDHLRSLWESVIYPWSMSIQLHRTAKFIGESLLPDNLLAVGRCSLGLHLLSVASFPIWLTHITPGLQHRSRPLTRPFQPASKHCPPHSNNTHCSPLRTSFSAIYTNHPNICYKLTTCPAHSQEPIYCRSSNLVIVYCIYLRYIYYLTFIGESGAYPDKIAFLMCVSSKQW